MRNLILIILLLLFCSAGTIAQTISAELDSTSITEHDELVLHLRIYGAANAEKPSVDLSPLQETEGIEILKEQEWDTLNLNGDVVFEKNIKLTSRDSGFYWVPGLSVSYSGVGSRTAKVTERLPLEVKPYTLASMEPAGIRGIKKEPLRLEDFIPLFIVLGICASLGLGIYLYLRNKKKLELEKVPPPIIPAHEIAIKKLQNLEREKLWQQGKVKEYQSQLTYIVREYLENRFKVNALESTTEEIVDALSEKDISDTHKNHLTTMFRMADMVKFAKAEPPADAHDKLFTQAESFVRKTKKEIIVDLETKSEAN